jgi:hypothetical protein
VPVVVGAAVVVVVVVLEVLDVLVVVVVAHVFVFRQLLFPQLDAHPDDGTTIDATTNAATTAVQKTRTGRFPCIGYSPGPVQTAE